MPVSFAIWRLASSWLGHLATTVDGVPTSPVNFAHELLDHPQLQANGYVVELDHELSGPYRVTAPPWKMSATPPQAQGASPALGRDNETLLASAGYSAAEIETLRSAGVIR